MIEVGRVCVKTAGRDSGKQCIIIDLIDDNFVTVDGYTRRKRVNVKHLEPLTQVTKVKKNASHEDVVAELEKLGMKTKAKKKIGKKEKSEKTAAPKKAPARKPAPKKKA